MAVLAEGFRPTTETTGNFLKNTKKFTPGDFVTHSLDTQRAPYEMSRPAERAGTMAWIQYFDNNWQKEGLPFDWYTLKNKQHKVGFSMKGQLRTLMNLDDAEQVAQFRKRTKQDLLGFKLEYLSDHLIYPRKYTLKPEAGRMEDRLYGTVNGNPDSSPDSVEVVSEAERNGTVKASLKKMKEFFLSSDTPVGATAVMFSPKGDTGLKTDDGSSITYPDSYFFIMQKESDNTVMNYTLKTNFSLEECRKAVFALTGKVLPENAQVEDFVKTIATIRPGEHPQIQDAQDVVKLLQLIHPQNPWQDKGWDSVYQDIADKEKLYDFDTKTHDIIDDFEEFCVPGYPTKIMYQKGIAAALLCMSDAYYREEDKRKGHGTLSRNIWQYINFPQSFGAVMAAVAEKPGCAGGGSKKTTAVITAGGERLGVVGEDKYGSLRFNCPDCGGENIRDKGELLDQCKLCKSTRVSC